MAISINPSVETNLKKFASVYPNFFKALHTINTTYNDLNRYWTGDRYKKIMGAWNKTVPDLNKQLKALAEASKILNTIFKNYTIADTHAVTVASAEMKELTPCTISNNKDINFDDTKLTSDLSKVLKEFRLAGSDANEMKKQNTTAEWSDDGGAIDRAKNDVDNALTQIIAYITKLSADIDSALKATSTDFGKARKSYGK